MAAFATPPRALRRRLLRGAAAALLSLAVPFAARAAPQVDLALVLAVDASGSVSQQRFELQKQGYAAAFRDPRVLNTIRSGGNQSIAVTMFQWTGPQLHIQVVPWMVIRDEGSAGAFAAAIEAAPRQLFGGGTSISGAIDYARALLAQMPAEPARRVIDVSGDGSNNSGRLVTLARDEAVRAGIGINGLPILAVESDLDHYYRDYVIGGPGAFMVPATSYETFAEAIIKKLITEIADAAYPGGAVTGSRTRQDMRKIPKVRGVPLRRRAVPQPCDQRIDGGDRAEIGWRDLAFRNADRKLRLDR